MEQYADVEFFKNHPQKQKLLHTWYAHSIIHHYYCTCIMLQSVIDLGFPFVLRTRTKSFSTKADTINGINKIKSRIIVDYQQITP